MKNKVNYTQIGKYIKEKRINSNRSLNSFAIENDIDPAILSRIENLKQNIKLNVLEKVAFGFNLTPAEFLTNFENGK